MVIPTATFLAEMQVLDFADLYAGKLSAALPRQHPRDLFDMQPLLDGDKLDERTSHAISSRRSPRTSRA